MHSTTKGVIAIFAGICSLLAVASRCTAEDKGVKIVEQRQGDSVVLVARLTNVTDATMTMSVDLENLFVETPLPATIESDGKSEVQVAVLHVIDRTKPYKLGYRLEWKVGGKEKGQPKAFSYSLPYKDGPYRVRQGFLGRFSHYAGSQDEYAIDWSMPIGTNLYAARAGTVIAFRSDVEDGGPNARYKTDYNYLDIRHDDGTYAEYLHLDTDGVRVKLGEKVSQGQLIAVSGNTGYTSEPHLHFAVFNTVTGRLRRTIPIEFALAISKRVPLREGKSY